MLKYFKDEYTDGREPVDFGILAAFLEETLRLTSNVEVREINCSKTVLLFLAGINYYFYLHPEQYVDFGKFVAYRSIDMKNLWTLEAKDGETAQTIYEFFKNGGLEMEEVKRIVESYATDLLQNSTQKLTELSEDIDKLGNIVSQDDEVTQQHKENKNGI